MSAGTWANARPLPRAPLHFVYVEVLVFFVPLSLPFTNRVFEPMGPLPWPPSSSAFYQRRRY